MTQQENLFNEIEQKKQTTAVAKVENKTIAPSLPVSKLDKIKNMMTSFKSEYASALLGTNMQFDHFFRIAVTYMQKNPKIAECEPASVCGAFIEMAVRGFEPASGQGHIIPFKNNKSGKLIATFIPGWKGCAKLFMNHFLAQSIEVEIVYKNDVFSFQKGYNKDLTHIPNIDNPGEVVAFYCICRLTNGGWNYAVMSVAQAEAHRDKYSKNYNSEFTSDENKLWVTNFDDMALKTVAMKCLKLMPFDLIPNVTAQVIDPVTRTTTPIPLSPTETEPESPSIIDVAV